MTKVEPGMLIDVVRLQRSAASADELGQDVEDWADVVTVRAMVRGGLVREIQVAGQVKPVSVRIVTIRDPRGRFAIYPTDRIVVEGQEQVLNVVGTIPDGLHEYVDVNCVEATVPA